MGQGIEPLRLIREEFGVRDLLVVVVQTSDPAGVFNARTLQHVAALTRELQAIPSVRPEDVTSLATEPGDRVHTGTLDFRTWLDPLPKTPEESSDLRRRLARAPIYGGTLLSCDAPPSATAILVGVEDGIDREALARGVRSAVEAIRSTPSSADLPDRVLLAGAPLAESQLGEHLLLDLALLVPIAFAVMGTILFLSWRSVGIALLLLSGVGSCLVATFGLMGWCGAPVYLTCLVVPADGDPALEVGYWLDEAGTFVDAGGSILPLLGAGSGRSATVVEREGRPAAVLIHDPAVLNDQALLDAVGAAAQLESANARLHAEVRAQIAELAASRLRILEAGDQARQRLERRLHDGAGRRLAELQETLHQGRLEATGPQTRDEIAQGEVQLRQAVEELRQLAQGLHPRALSERGLAGARPPRERTALRWTLALVLVS
jgi:hypothetical protein